uniref:G_PROTEIN_RECEP_F1_2 domain-containing protein n=1 Tax=Panagrellus redivivus TaxID=6233 RepID=A0A7E4VNJ5_PANRE
MLCSQELELFDLENNDTLAFLNALINVSNGYGTIHKYLAPIICLVGSVVNCVHLAVLTRPVMRKCAVNRLLSLMVVCDITTMVSYIIFMIRFGFMMDLNNPPKGYALHWIVFLLIHVVLSIAMHTITLYMSVATAFVRYKALKEVGSKWNQSDSALPIFIVITIFVTALCIPTFLVHEIVHVDNGNGTGDLYMVELSELSRGNTCFVFKANLWLTGIVFKVIPCLMLFIFTIALLSELDLNRRRRRRLTSGASMASKRISKKTDRTTLMLIVLMTIFIVTEFPQGILAILNGLFPNDIHQFVYLSLGEILDLLSLINCNASFVVYSIMSSVYRTTLRNLIDRTYNGLSLFSSRSMTKSVIAEMTQLKFVDETDILL